MSEEHIHTSSTASSHGDGDASILSALSEKVLSKYNSIELAIDGFGIFEHPITKYREIIRRYTWKNIKNKTTVQVISYGATIVSIKTPDRHGNTDDIVLGFENIEGYLDKRNPYFGATVGRVCNRIAYGKFELNGKTVDISRNWMGIHTLHGGFLGFDKFNWTSYTDKNKVVMTHVSPDGLEGFPGTIMTTVTYELLSDNSFQIKMSATTTKPSPINLTNHSYFNLAGHASGYPELYKHIVAINADKITETDETSIPTGHLKCVGGSLFDFRIPRELGPIMARVPSRGYDDNFCVTQGTEQKLTFVARVIHPETGRAFELYSDQPGVQFYTSNHMPDPLKIITPSEVNLQYFYYEEPKSASEASSAVKITESDSISKTGSVPETPIIGKGGAQYLKHGAFCLETQKYPDAVNHTNFPSIILNPGETYQHEIIYKFGIHRGPHDDTSSKKISTFGDEEAEEEKGFQY